jgi:zinc and cadmium transporter
LGGGINHSNIDYDRNPSSSVKKQPLTYLILIANTVYSFIGGMFVGASFVDSLLLLGVSFWLGAATHEIPQELGDFAILVRSSWSKRQALAWHFLSHLTFLLGGIIAFATYNAADVTFLIPFAAGNFLYIGATDLIPKITHYHGV